MNTLVSEPLARTLRFDTDTMWVDLADGRQLGVPLAYFPRLLHASPDALMKYTISGGGKGLHWDDPDIMVVMETDEPPFTRGGIISDLLWGRGFAIDSYICTPGEFNYLQEVEDPFLMEVLSYGRTLYEQNT